MRSEWNGVRRRRGANRFENDKKKSKSGSMREKKGGKGVE